LSKNEKKSTVKTYDVEEHDSNPVGALLRTNFRQYRGTAAGHW